MLFPRLGLSDHSFSLVVFHRKCSTAVLSVAEAAPAHTPLESELCVQTLWETNYLHTRAIINTSNGLRIASVAKLKHQLWS